MTFALPLGGIQQAGAPETGAKNVSPCFYFRLVITSAYIQVYFMLSTTSTRNLNLRKRSTMALILQYLHYTQCLINHVQLVSHTALIRFD